ncbi:hypothetical protein C7271_20210, partial [filamentous cyanobacterium CCP5]
PASRQRGRYAITLFCRLVALAAMQGRGLLNGDEWYLQNQFGQSQQRGPDGFFKQVLQPLWSQGICLPPQERPLLVQAQLGDLPYLPPSLFESPDLGLPESQLTVPDAAFEPLLVWLGDLAVESPDFTAALGPILEGWVNQQQGKFFSTPAVLLEAMGDRLLTPAVLACAYTATHQQYDTVADLLMGVTPKRAVALFTALQDLTLLDPACGSGRYLVAVLEQLEGVLGGLLAIAADHLPAPKNRLALQRQLLPNTVGADLWPEAVEISRLQLLLWLLQTAESADSLAELPDPRLSVIPGNALMGLVHVDSERFDQVPPRRKATATPVLQGNLLQPLLADDYEDTLRQQQIHLEHYRSQTYLLSEGTGVPAYVQAAFLSDRIDALNRVAETKLNHLLLNELSQQLGLRHRDRDPESQRQRLLTEADIDALHPLHWGFHCHPILSRGGFDLILCHPPTGPLQPTATGAFDQNPDAFDQQGITRESFDHNSTQLREVAPPVEALWRSHRDQMAFLKDCFRRLRDYRYATQPAPHQRQAKLYWERLYLERIVQLLRPGGHAAVLMPPSLWHHSNGQPLRDWLHQTGDLQVCEFSNQQKALGDLPSRTALSLVSCVKGPAAAEPIHAVWTGSDAPSPETLGLYLQGGIDLPVEVQAIARIV